MSGATASALEKTVGKTVVVILKNGQRLRGKLRGFDQHLNLILGEAENVTKPENIKKIGSIILRGDAIIYILLMLS
ncbi:MAG: LSM domain-containing protein [Candidatus Bathyarchaeia archaeon]